MTETKVSSRIDLLHEMRGRLRRRLEVAQDQGTRDETAESALACVERTLQDAEEQECAALEAAALDEVAELSVEAVYARRELQKAQDRLDFLESQILRAEATANQYHVERERNSV